jgi:hypothetical protein
MQYTPRGNAAMDGAWAHARGAQAPWTGRDQPGNGPAVSKKNLLKPWRKVMWCIGHMTREYRQRMYGLLALYARPYDPREPVICVDEKSKQLLEGIRPTLQAQRGVVRKEDYEYRRAGTCNLFVAVEPQAGHREIQVTARRTKEDFVGFVRHLVNKVYATVGKVHLVLDNLNTHFRNSFEEVMGVRAARSLLKHVEFHYTPKHASWLNMAEIEIGILDRQCIGGRIPNTILLAEQVATWQHHRNTERRRIDWRFTRRDADRKLSRHYVA